MNNRVDLITESLLSKGPFKRIIGKYILPKSDPDKEILRSNVPKVKRDRYGNKIDKSKKLQQVSFRDNITGKDLVDIKEVLSQHQSPLFLLMLLLR